MVGRQGKARFRLHRAARTDRASTQPAAQVARRCAVALVAACCALPGGVAWALDGSSDTPADAKASLSNFANPQQAMRQGIAGYRAGDVKSSVEAFTDG